MRRRPFVVASLLSATVMAGAVHPPAARTSGSARVIDDPDAYDVYASLVRASHDSGAPDVSQYVIRRETFTLATGCAVSGEPTDSVWRTALADYVSINRLPHALVEGYAFDLPYTLVPTIELQEAFAEDAVEWQTFSARFPAAIGYFTFSGVGFSPDRTLAVVYVEHFCTPLCGSGRLEFLHKQGGRWRPARVTGVRTCGWIS